ncbi:autoinducer 2 sensor kinase/phosphatase LuxQ [Geobacter sp. OR-1]|uniref:response regulator n=1 Tax=Geobacter sp. OR-1 TaxID=1266765 RepID=UPI0005420C35|nr:response regulator [Geobacter sp. OR-1]GAM09063.1 autoinducer 2 sensor kinase/phosphatase LuxQ [Geobacter sp. OR-1]
MGWYANLKIGKKLVLGFVSVIVISGLVGIAGIKGMGELDGMLVNLYGTTLVSTVYVNEAYTQLIMHNRRIYRHIASGEKGVEEQVASQLKINEMAISEAMGKYRKTSLVPTETELLERFNRIWPEYLSVTARILKISSEGRNREAVALAENEGRPLFYKLNDTLAELVRYNLAEGKQQNDEAERLFHAIRYWMIALILATVAIGAAMSFFITRSVVSPLRQVLDAVLSISEGGEEKARLAEAISSGDLSQDVAITERLRLDLDTVPKDEAGMLLKAVAGLSDMQSSVDAAFSRMTESLRRSRKEDQERDWLKTGTNDLNAILRGDRRVGEMVEQSLAYLCEYLGAGVGAFYFYNDNSRDLEIGATYALTRRKNLNERIVMGEGLAGEAAKERKVICLTNVPPDYLPISSATGESKPLNIAAVPLLHNDRLVGVLELGSFNEFMDKELEFLQLAREGLAIGISISISRKQIDELLEQTQAQTEELRVQQEELQQTNEELEERAQMLEQQREQIRAKNREVEEASLEIRRKAEELERVSTYKSEFLANMSHELRTPLNSLMILSSLLRENRDGNLTEKQVEYAATINSSGNDLLNLINDILDLSKIESGRLEFNYEPLSVQTLFGQIRTMFAPIAEQRGLAFDVAIEEGVPEEITTDSQRTQQILKNLISNACKFTTSGEVTVRVFLPSVAENPLNAPAIAVEVADTGVGIAVDKHELVFQAFQQADGTTSRRFGGTGLGLSISRQLARGLHGDILLQSNEGQGSTFTLYLPLAPSPATRELHKDLSTAAVVPDRDAVNPDASADLAPAPVQDDRERLLPGERSILIIEDDLNFAGILMDMVRKRGFAAIVAADGESGIMLAERFLPSAIILDVMLPKVDGWGVMRSLKGDMKTRHIPVHFLTCLEDRQKAMSMGAVGFLKKPVDSEQLNQLFGTIEQSISRTVRKLLIVEESRDEANSMVDLLAERDVAITVAVSGREAIERLTGELFDCVVLDLGLSDISGFEVLAKMQELDEPLRPPVIIHSGKELTHEDEHRLRNYAESIIIKGAKSPERLLNEVTLFLHVVEGGIAPDKQRMIRQALDSEVILEGKKVLIVDDDMRNIFSLSSILAEKNMQVVEAENGVEALERLNEQPDVDVVLMDIMMPEMDGYTAIRKIRKDARFAKLPIIALTAKAMKGDRDDCLKAGASDYIPKPVEVEKLFSLLRVWLYGN